VKSSILSEPAAINTASATAPMVCHSQCFEQPSKFEFARPCYTEQNADLRRRGDRE